MEPQETAKLENIQIEKNNLDIVNKKTGSGSKLIILVASFFVLITIALGGVFYLLKNKPADIFFDIDRTNREIETSLNNISDNTDLNDDLDISYNLSEEGIPAIDNSLKDIDSILNDLNKSTDFSDIGTINFTQ